MTRSIKLTISTANSPNFPRPPSTSAAYIEWLLCVELLLTVDTRHLTRLCVCVCMCVYECVTVSMCLSNPNSLFFSLHLQHVRLSFFSLPPTLPRPIAACAPTAVKTTYSIMKMSSPRIMQQKRSSKSSNSSRVSMTTSTAEENLIESKLFSWMRLFRFASLLCRAE